MTVSVIIPVYNIEKYLRECLDSVVSQTFNNLDIILVDDGSRDNSPAICDEYARRDSRIRVLHRDNRGPSVARNHGIDNARGEFLTFVDADDIIHPEMIRKLVGAIGETKTDIASCRWYRGVRPAFKVFDDSEPTVSDSTKTVEYMLYQTSGVKATVWGHIYRRWMFDDGLRFTPGILYEDLDIAPILFEKARKVTSIKDVLYFYRDTPTSIINTWSVQRLDALEVTAKLEEHFRENQRLYAAARDRRLSAAFNIFMLNARQGKSADEEVTRRCYKILKERRGESLFNPEVRFKNKAGILVSYFGRNILTMLSKL